MEMEACSTKGEMGGDMAKVGLGEVELQAWPGCVADGGGAIVESRGCSGYKGWPDA